MAAGRRGDGMRSVIPTGAREGTRSPPDLLGSSLEGRQRGNHGNTDLVDQTPNVGCLDTVVVHEDGKNKTPIVEGRGVARNSGDMR